MKDVRKLIIWSIKHFNPGSELMISRLKLDFVINWRS